MGNWLFTSLLLIGVAPGGNRQTVATKGQRVDLIELNHFIDEKGREVFRQVIFYDWSPSHRRFHVRAWRLAEGASDVLRLNIGRGILELGKGRI